MSRRIVPVGMASVKLVLDNVGNSGRIWRRWRGRRFTYQRIRVQTATGWKVDREIPQVLCTVESRQADGHPDHPDRDTSNGCWRADGWRDGVIVPECLLPFWRGGDVG